MGVTPSSSVGAAATSIDAPIRLDGFGPSSLTFRAVVAWLERQSLFVGGLAMVGVVMVATLPLHIHQDAYLALVGGRYVSLHGIPHHDTLAVMTSGARWIDQQWLAQLTLYELQRLGGMALFGIAYAAMTLGGAAIAITAARRLGGSERHVTWVLPLAAFLYFGGSLEVRTQGFAYPLFASVLWLLAAESRRPTCRRVYLVFPLLILWGNLHGSVVIGVALTALYGVTLLIADARHRLPLRVRRRTLVFLVGGPLCLLVTPYGLAGIAYYSETLNNPLFKALVTEWRPVTSIAILAVPFFVAAFATVWLFGQSRGRARLFDVLALLFLIFAGISAVRNVTWFALAALMLLPALLGTVTAPRRAAPRRPRANLALAGLGCVALVGALTSVATKPAPWFEHAYDKRALRTVMAQVKQWPSVRIYAASEFGDWLLWHEPGLAGRVAFDTRFELLTQAQMNQLGHITEPSLPGQTDLLAGYGILVLDRNDQTGTRPLLKRTGARVITAGRGVEVATVGGA